MKTVLMIGGPADGRWMVTDGLVVVVAEFGPLEWTPDSVNAASNLKQIQYHVQAFAVLGMKLDVAVAEREFRTSRDRDNAVIRALFQRDVAEAMGAFK